MEVKWDMFLAALILILGTGLWCFYVQAVSQKILGRRFAQDYFQAIANANRLEFPAVRKEIEKCGAALEYARLRESLKRDFMALTYLLKNATNVERRYTYQERLLFFTSNGPTLT